MSSPTAPSGRSRSRLLAVLIALTATAAAVALIVVLVNGSADGSPRASRTTQDQNLAAANRTSSAATTDRPTTAAPSTAAPTTTAPTTTAPSGPTAAMAPRTSSAAAAPKPPLTYVVRKGDNLTVIAKWFHLHGYGALYERNRAVIGNDPNLIVPGQHITVSSAGMTVRG